MNKQLKIGLVFLVICGAFCLTWVVTHKAGQTRDSRHLLETAQVKESFAMGTYIKVTCYDKGKSQVISKALDEASKLDKILTVNQAGSVIDAINKQAGQAPVQVPQEIFELIQKAKKYSETHTGFDLAIGSLTQLWHIGFDDAKKPSQAEIDQALKTVNADHVVLDQANKTVYIDTAGTQLDLGAIAKGYLLDDMQAILTAGGVTTAIIDIGSSSLYLKGYSPRGPQANWRVGIKDPNNKVSDEIGELEVHDKAVSTSGIYERYLEVNGVKYPHLLNPKTGYPFDNTLLSVTLVTDKGIDGDALSTTLFALGLKDGFDYIEHQTGVEAIFVDKLKRVYVTPGLKDQFSLSKGSSYQLGQASDLK